MNDPPRVVRRPSDTFGVRQVGHGATIPLERVMGLETTPSLQSSAAPPGASDDVEVARVKAVLESRLSGLPVVSTRIGRFVVLDRIGAGGMGVVYAAFDPQLDRKVAIKLLFEGKSDERVRAGLRGEAKAMAQLAHPNVIGVYEVGEHEGRLFVAMEHVRGRTLKQWATDAPRSWREILAACVQAGRGLAAAHAAGIVHRDFKPDNVLVADDDRPRVLDFGLARQPVRDDEDADAATSAANDVSLKLTRTGALIGTPAYMAPEQIRGEPVDARADQFAFCVTVWEVLTGERPFAGDTLETLFDHVSRGARRDARRGAMPRRLEAVLHRGLAREPAARYPDIGALLAAIERTTSVRPRWLFAVPATLAIASIAAWSAWTLVLEQRRDRCEADADAIAEVWNDDAKARLHDALVATGVPYAESTFGHAVPFVDRYAEGWQRTYDETCVATEVDGERSAELWAASSACLEQRRGELAALLEVLTNEADEAVASQTISAVAGLTSLDGCVDDARLVREASLDSSAAPAELQARIWRAVGLDAAGKYTEALELARGVAAETAKVEEVHLRRRALLLAGSAAYHGGSNDEATRLLGEAFDLSFAAGDDLGAATAATQLVEALGHWRPTHDDALHWGRVALGLLARADAMEDVAAARLDEVLAVTHLARGQAARPDVDGSYSEAEQLMRRAIATRERVQGSDHPDVGRAYVGLAEVLTRRSDLGCSGSEGCYDEALSTAQHGLAIEERALGADHPALARSLVTSAAVEFALGAYGGALEHAFQANALFERVAPDHVDHATVLWLLASIHQNRGEYARSQAYYESTLAVGSGTPSIWEATSCDLATVLVARGTQEDALRMFERGLVFVEREFGSDSLVRMTCASNLANLHGIRGSYEEAERLHREAIAIGERAAKQVFLAPVFELYANTELRRGDHRAAKQLYARAIEIRARHFGSDWAGHAALLPNLARAELVVDGPAQARATAERAIGLATQQGDHALNWYAADDHGNLSHVLGPGVVPWARFVLATIAWEEGDREHAHSLAVEARDALRFAGEGFERRVVEIEAWIEAHADRRGGS